MFKLKAAAGTGDEKKRREKKRKETPPQHACTFTFFWSHILSSPVNARHAWCSVSSPPPLHLWAVVVLMEELEFQTHSVVTPSHTPVSAYVLKDSKEPNKRNLSDSWAAHQELRPNPSDYYWEIRSSAVMPSICFCLKFPVEPKCHEPLNTTVHFSVVHFSGALLCGALLL